MGASDEKKTTQKRTSLDIHAMRGEVDKDLHATPGQLSDMEAGKKTTFTTSEKSTWTRADDKAKNEEMAGLQKDMMKKPRGHLRQTRDGTSREKSTNKI
jgi:hypothetical protein